MEVNQRRRERIRYRKRHSEEGSVDSEDNKKFTIETELEICSSILHVNIRERGCNSSSVNIAHVQPHSVVLLFYQ
jgi:hypothetical protein